MIGEGQEGLLWHGVDREGRRQRHNVEDVGGLGILRGGTGQEQALGSGPRRWPAAASGRKPVDPRTQEAILLAFFGVPASRWLSPLEVALLTTAIILLLSRLA